MKRNFSLTLCLSLILGAFMLSSCEKDDVPDNAIRCSHCKSKGWTWPGNHPGPFALFPSKCTICDGDGYYYPIKSSNNVIFKGKNSDNYILSSDIYLERTDTHKNERFNSYKKGYNTYVHYGYKYIQVNGVYRVKIGSHHYYGL